MVEETWVEGTWLTISAVIEMVPLVVNLMELLSRFIRTCLIRFWSEMIKSGIVSDMYDFILMPLASTWFFIMNFISSMNPLKFTLDRFNSNFLNYSLDKSYMYD